MRWISFILPFTFFLEGEPYHHAGEFSIIQSPEGLLFSGQEELDLSSVKNVLSTALGFSVPDVPRWSGLTVKDPFQFADALVGMVVPGVATLDPSSQGHSYPLNADESLEETFDVLQFRLNERYPLITNLTALNVNLGDRKHIVDQFGELNLRELPSVQHLNPLESQDKEFLEQIQLLDAITTKLCSRMCNDKKEPVVKDGIPDIYWFNFTSMEPLLISYSRHSDQVEEAKKLLTSSILLLSEVFNTAYDYQVVFSVISSQVVPPSRSKRSTGGDTTIPRSTMVDEDQDFPVMFNIFLWFNIGLVFALISVCYGIATMDPGRDSIIYRMTSNRMKKDN